MGLSSQMAFETPDNNSLRIATHYDDMVQEVALKLAYGLGGGLVTGLVLFRGGAGRMACAAGGAGFGAGYAYARESMRFETTKMQLASKLAANQCPLSSLCTVTTLHHRQHVQHCCTH